MTMLAESGTRPWRGRGMRLIRRVAFVSAVLLLSAGRGDSWKEDVTHRAFARRTAGKEQLPPDEQAAKAVTIPAPDRLVRFMVATARLSPSWAANDETKALAIPVFKVVAKELADGAQAEDLPIDRAFNHFYNPRREVGGAAGGLDDPKVRGFVNAAITVLDGTTLPATEWGYDAANNKYRWTKIFTYAVKSVGGGSESDRDADWGRVLWRLGGMLHLVQDMGQPQHTRDDVHAGRAWYLFLIRWITGNTVYEDWGERNLRDAIDGQRPFLDEAAKKFDDGGKEPLLFLSYKDYLRYVAKFSHAYFMSEDTIAFDDARWVGPKKEWTNYAIFEDNSSPGPDGRMLLLTSPVQLPGYPPPPPPGMALAALRHAAAFRKGRQSESPFLKKTDLHITREVVEAQVPHLVRRISEASTGLVNWFFRGSVDFCVRGVDDGDPETDLRELTVWNISAFDPNGEWKPGPDVGSGTPSPPPLIFRDGPAGSGTPGVFRLYGFQDAGGESRVEIEAARIELDGGSLAPGQSLSVQFLMPAGLLLGAVTYEGYIDDEPGMAGRVKSWPLQLPIGGCQQVPLPP